MHWWALGLVLNLGYYEHCCSSHGCQVLLWPDYSEPFGDTRRAELSHMEVPWPQGLEWLAFPAAVDKVPLSLNPHQRWLPFLLSASASLTGARRTLSIVLACVHLTAEDTESFFIRLLAICISLPFQLSVQLICILTHWIIWGTVVESCCCLCILSIYPVRWISPILQAVSSLWWLFTLLWRIAFISCNPIPLFTCSLPELLESHSVGLAYICILEVPSLSVPLGSLRISGDYDLIHFGIVFM